MDLQEQHRTNLHAVRTRRTRLSRAQACRGGAARCAEIRGALRGRPLCAPQTTAKRGPGPEIRRPWGQSASHAYIRMYVRKAAAGGLSHFPISVYPDTPSSVPPAGPPPNSTGTRPPHARTRGRGMPPPTPTSSSHLHTRPPEPSPFPSHNQEKQPGSGPTAVPPVGKRLCTPSIDWSTASTTVAGVLPAPRWREYC